MPEAWLSVNHLIVVSFKAVLDMPKLILYFPLKVKEVRALRVHSFKGCAERDIMIVLTLIFYHVFCFYSLENPFACSLWAG